MFCWWFCCWLRLFETIFPILLCLLSRSSEFSSAMTRDNSASDGSSMFLSCESVRSLWFYGSVISFVARSLLSWISYGESKPEVGGPRWSTHASRHPAELFSFLGPIPGIDWWSHGKSHFDTSISHLEASRMGLSERLKNLVAGMARLFLGQRRHFSL